MSGVDHVTRSELAAHLEPMRDDIREIKADVKTMVDARWLGPRGRTLVDGLIIACIAGLVSGVVALLLAFL